jgi:hypothetical protein
MNGHNLQNLLYAFSNLTLGDISMHTAIIYNIYKTALVLEKGRLSKTVIEKAKALSSWDLATFIPDEI